MTSKPHRPLREIAKEVWADIHSGKWNSYHYAEPYLSAMSALDQITDDYYADSGKSVVLYFLSNTGTWRGETARRVKAELKVLVNHK